MNKRIITKEEAASVKNIIRKYIVAEGSTIEKVAKRVSDKYPNANDSGNNLTQKLNNGTIKFLEVTEIADVLGYDLKWIKRK